MPVFIRCKLCGAEIIGPVKMEMILRAVPQDERFMKVASRIAEVLQDAREEISSSSFFLGFVSSFIVSHFSVFHPDALNNLVEVHWDT